MTFYNPKFMNKDTVSKIEVFVTNIQNAFQSEQIKEDILAKYPKLKIDFDLEDVDKVLRVQGVFSSIKIIIILISNNYKCNIMLQNLKLNNT